MCPAVENTPAVVAELHLYCLYMLSAPRESDFHTRTTPAESPLTSREDMGFHIRNDSLAPLWSLSLEYTQSSFWLFSE